MSNKEIVPLVDWDDKDPSHPDLVWFTRFDGKFQIEVHSVATELDLSYRGTLHIFDHQKDNKLLMSEDVGLSYGARFGPDLEDIQEWQERVVKFVDEELPRT